LKGYSYIEYNEDAKGKKEKIVRSIVDAKSRWWKDEDKRRCL